ncbi:hypothetical protein L218DRAFT_1005794 [Marasmius fiardii PR-910]|nr:hypothetical protein L218DRAFT_1005794 [Marasmius fiardii PR-910]
MSYTEFTSIVNDIHRVQFPRSDGRSLKPRRPNTIPVQEQEEEDGRVTHKWYSATGEALARYFKWNVNPSSCILSSFPQDYTLCRSIEKRPGHGYEYFLCGSTISSSFRSPAEFIPHAIWLFEDPTLSKVNCKCLHCSRRPQKEVTADLKRLGVFPEISPSQTKSKPIPQTLILAIPQSAQNFDARAPISSQQQKQPQTHIPRPITLLPEYEPPRPQTKTAPPLTNSTIRYRPRSQFRIGDLVTVLLDHPITCVNSDTPITMWPAIVQAKRLVFCPELLEVIDPSLINLDDCDVLVRFLGFRDHTLTVAHKKILPYHPLFHTSCTVPTSLKLEENEATVNHAQAHDSTLTSFPSLFETAAPIYNHAVRSASKVASEWCALEPERFQIKILDTGEVSTKPKRIRFGGEELRLGDLVKVSLPTTDVDELTNKKLGSSVSSSSPSLGSGPDGIFGRVYEFEVKVDVQGKFNLEVTVALFSLKSIYLMGDDGDEQRLTGDSESLSPPPEGFVFHLLHDPGFEVVLSGEFIVGRYHPNYLARMLVDKRFDFCEDDELLEELSKLWEMAGLKMGRASGKIHVAANEERKIVNGQAWKGPSTA